MSKHGKKYAAALAQVDEERQYLPDEAIALLKQIAYAGFDETIEVHARLGIDPRQADQAVRSNVILPHGTGKQVRVLVFAAGEAERIALDAGADYAGTDELVQQIQGGWLEFDAAVAMADQMGKVGGLGRILGRRGLMPNPRSGTVVRNPEDLPGVLRDLKGGRVEFRNDRTGIVHTTIGRKSFSEDQIRDNLYAFVDALQRLKPASIKGIYCRTLTLTSTMAPGIALDVPVTLANASAAAA
ncbi:MAG: 50S ribosomal protein L1 [Chloroflexia bacterium]|nr:50S ribosomal protein L1 [Chloroflexia bacterium]MDQ3781120.1 50S ribosomal protein L1 [Chloroflexota bacterium]